MSNMDHNIAVAHKNESEVVDCVELPLNHESHHSVSSNQPNEQVEDDVIIDIKEMTQDNEEGLLSPNCCIYKVPDWIRTLNQEAYTPKAVSIGPFHYGNVRFQNMERHKQIVFKRFIRQSVASLKHLVAFAKRLEPDIRACYSENISLSKKELVKVILVDAAFIIELFKSRYERQLGSDAKFSKQLLRSAVLLDLLLLENQLPFFFLEKLFNKAFPHGNVPSFRKLTYDYLAFFNKQKLEVNHHSMIEHFTDLLRLFHLPREEHVRKPSKEVGDHILRYSASELYEAGLKFKVNKSKCLLDLKFSGHVLEIPEVRMGNSFNILFRNMIALEQFHYPQKSYITDFATIMDHLINTNKDVEVLTHKEIIYNAVGDSNDVVEVFNNLSRGTFPTGFNSNYLDICQSLNAFHRSPWNNLKATLTRDYCKTAWQTAASIAAIVLLILTLVQTIFSILAYVK